MSCNRPRIVVCSLTLAAAMALAPVAVAQDLTQVRQLYDQGKYQDVIGAVSGGAAGGDARLKLLYLQARAYEKLDARGEAADTYAALGGDDAPPVWQAIARSATDLLNQRSRDGLEQARQAVGFDARLPEAQFQLGLALSVNEEFARAAPAFDTAGQLDPSWAYPRYYAGLAYYRAQRVDLMASRFEAFLRLAPDAPERPEIQSIMRTLRAR